MDDIIKRVNKLKTLRQYKDKSPEELEEIAKLCIEKNKSEDSFSCLVEEVEIKSANKLLEKYLSEYQIETSSDRDTLNQLVFFEILNDRLRKSISEEYRDKKITPFGLLEKLHENTDKILLLKKELGMNRAFGQQSGISEWETLKKKAQNYLQTHKGMFWSKCPNCLKVVPFYVRADLMTPEKAVWFK